MGLSLDILLRFYFSLCYIASVSGTGLDFKWSIYFIFRHIEFLENLSFDYRLEVVKRKTKGRKKKAKRRLQKIFFTIISRR